MIGELNAEIIDETHGVHAKELYEVSELDDDRRGRLIKFTCGTSVLYVKRQELAVIMKDIFHGM
jgi:hypothetical protein